MGVARQSNPSVPPAPGGPSPRERHEVASAIEHATEYLLSLGLDRASDANGERIGLQATLVAPGVGPEGLALDALVSAPRPPVEAMRSSAAPTARVSRLLEEKLGFGPEPELFSNMLFVAALGATATGPLRDLCRALLSTFAQSDADGLYHFFRSLKFACDIDCTAMAAKARLAVGDIDPETPSGAAALRKITDRILKSAATCDVTAERNATHGKDNGPLRKHVFKVYPDDHAVQGPECDRGLKNNPVVVANALYPVLLELQLGLRSADEPIALCEHVEGERDPRTGEASVAEIVAANVCYATAFMLSGDYRLGCRYYTSPDAFVCFFSELVRGFPALFGMFRATRLIHDAVAERETANSTDPAVDPSSSLNTAFRAIAASNVGVEPSLSIERLLRAQDASGAWSDFDTFYTLGTAKDVQFRSTALTTAFAIRALVTYQAGVGPRNVAPAEWTGPIVDRVIAAVS